MTTCAPLPARIRSICYVQGPLLRYAPYEEDRTIKWVPTHDLPPIYPGRRIQCSDSCIQNMRGVLSPIRNQLTLLCPICRRDLPAEEGPSLYNGPKWARYVASPIDVLRRVLLPESTAALLTACASICTPSKCRPKDGCSTISNNSSLS